LGARFSELDLSDPEFIPGRRPRRLSTHDSRLSIFWGRHQVLAHIEQV